MVKDSPSNKSIAYLEAKAQKKRSGYKAFIVMLMFGFVIVTVLAKIILTGSFKSNFFNGTPNSNDAYIIAKEFIQPTLKSSNIDFNDSKYQFEKRSDSVYVIKSSVNSKNENGEKISTEFRIVLKYNGGAADKQKNWSLIDLSENQDIIAKNSW